MNAVEEIGGCPIELITDLGTQNGIAAAIQCYFRADINAHRYVSSPRNQRIESWWSQFSKLRVAWWKSFFHDLEARRVFDGTSDIHKEALWYSFNVLLQNELDQLKEHWNSHYIRKSRHETVSGRPDILFNLPEDNGGEDNLKLEVPNAMFEYVRDDVITYDGEQNYYTEYFDYIRGELNINLPDTIEDAVSLFQVLIFHAED